MSLLSTTPRTGILLAIVLSVLLHLALLFTPMIELAPTEVPLPPLQAKLENLPKLAAAPPKKVARKVKPHPPAHTPPAAAPQAPTELATAPAAVTPEPEAVTPEPEKTVPDTAPAAASAVAAPPPSTHPLPRQAQLTFSVYKSGTSFAIGEAQHRLSIDADQHYTLRISANTTGVVRWLKRFELTQTSSGMLTPYGLQPDKFVEQKLTSDGTITQVANFDREERLLHFSAGNASALPDGSQDIASFMYQLSQLQWGDAPLSLYISNGRKLEHYQIEVGEEELLDTPMGKLRTIPMRKLHGPDEEGLNIWLAVEYRLLPVKISQIERDGRIAGEMLIADIRVADQ